MVLLIDEYMKRGFSSIFLRTLNPYGRAKKDRLQETYSVDEFVEAYKKALDYIFNINYNEGYFIEEYTALLLKMI